MFDVSCTANLDMQNHTTVVCFLKQYYKSIHSQLPLIKPGTSACKTMEDFLNALKKTNYYLHDDIWYMMDSCKNKYDMNTVYSVFQINFFSETSRHHE